MASKIPSQELEETLLELQHVAQELKIEIESIRAADELGNLQRFDPATFLKLTTLAKRFNEKTKEF